MTVYKDRVFFTHRNFLWALDRKTGKPIQGFGDNGRIDLRQGLGRPPENMTVSASTPGVIFEDTIIMGSTVPETLPGSPGHIVCVGFSWLLVRDRRYNMAYGAR